MMRSGVYDSIRNPDMVVSFARTSRSVRIGSHYTVVLLVEYG